MSSQRLSIMEFPLHLSNNLKSSSLQREHFVKTQPRYRQTAINGEDARIHRWSVETSGSLPGNQSQLNIQHSEGVCSLCRLSHGCTNGSFIMCAPVSILREKERAEWSSVWNNTSVCDSALIFPKRSFLSIEVLVTRKT